MIFRSYICALIAAIAVSAPLVAQSSGAANVRIVLNERTRLLQGQLFDLVLEVRNTKAVTNLKVTAGAVDLTSKFAAPKAADLDCDASTDWVLRADLTSLDIAGDVPINVSLTADSASLSTSRTVEVREFGIASAQRRNIVLFIGDALGTAYRDAARLVSHCRCVDAVCHRSAARSLGIVLGHDGPQKPRFRNGLRGGCRAAS